MATTNSATHAHSTDVPAKAGMVAFVAPMGSEQLAKLVAKLSGIFPATDLVIATPNDMSGSVYPSLRVISTQATNAVWALAAADFLHAVNVAKENEARGVLMLGPGAESLSAEALRDLASAV